MHAVPSYSGPNDEPEGVADGWGNENRFGGDPRSARDPSFAHHTVAEMSGEDFLAPCRKRGTAEGLLLHYSGSAVRCRIVMRRGEVTWGCGTSDGLRSRREKVHSKGEAIWW